MLAGTRILAENTDLNTSKTTKQETLIDATRLRVNIGDNTSVLFLTDGGRNRMVMLDRLRNEYREIDQQTMDQMAQRMQGMTAQMAQMEEQMKNMPPQQREMMERMMKGKMPGMPAPRASTVYTQKGNGNVNGFACTQHEGTRNGQKVAEVCAASAAALKLGAGDMQTFEKVREFMAGFQRAMATSPLSSMINSESFVDAGIQGVPVQRTGYADGKAVDKMEIKSANPATFSDADFSLGNAKKVEMPMGPP